MLFLVAYDIADPRRLRRVARRMEKAALRCQKSVFLFRGDEVRLGTLLEAVRPLLDAKEDVVQAWKLAADETPEGRICGEPAEVAPAGVVLARRVSLVVKHKARANPSAQENTA